MSGVIDLLVMKIWSDSLLEKRGLQVFFVRINSGFMSCRVLLVCKEWENGGSRTWFSYGHVLLKFDVRA